MLKKLLSIAVSFYLALISSHAAACAGHLYLNPDNFGVMGNLAIKLAGLAPPEPIFKLKHPPLAKATLGEESEITVEYERPWFSKDVHMQLKSSNGITLIDKYVALDDYDGTLKIRYLLEKPGHNSIKIQVNGVHKGQSVISSRVIYIQPKKSSTETHNLQVTAR